MMITAIEPPAIIEEVRYRRHYRYIRIVRKPKPTQPVETPTWCTEASPEFCGDEPPVVYYKVFVNPNTFEERWNDQPLGYLDARAAGWCAARRVKEEDETSCRPVR